MGDTYMGVSIVDVCISFKKTKDKKNKNDENIGAARRQSLKTDPGDEDDKDDEDGG